MAPQLPVSEHLLSTQLSCRQMPKDEVQHEVYPSCLPPPSPFVYLPECGYSASLAATWLPSSPLSPGRVPSSVREGKRPRPTRTNTAILIQPLMLEHLDLFASLGHLPKTADKNVTTQSTQPTKSGRELGLAGGLVERGNKQCVLFLKATRRYWSTDSNQGNRVRRVTKQTRLRQPPVTASTPQVRSLLRSPLLSWMMRRQIWPTNQRRQHTTDGALGARGHKSPFRCRQQRTLLPQQVPPVSRAACQASVRLGEAARP
ncbi:hypothetical protein HDV57DRAFT_60218 [Trichoderma longibrachiatum]